MGMSPLPTAAAPRPAPTPRRSLRLPLAAAVIVVGMVVVGHSIDVARYTSAAQGWTTVLGPLAPVVYILAYVAATLVGVPSVPFTLLAAILFGPMTGLLVMVAASSISAGIAFLIARYLARDTVAERLAGTEAFARMSALAETHDWALIPLVRIFPIAPFVLVNYGFGLTGIGFWRYLGWSALAMVPSNAVLVLSAHFFYDATMRGAVSWPVAGASAAAAVVLLALVAVVRRARPWPARRVP